MNADVKRGIPSAKSASSADKTPPFSFTYSGINMSAAIEIRNLTHAYRNGVPVLEGVDLTIDRGEFVGLIGLSGAGKSTLLRCINGLQTQTGGTCVVLGEHVEKLSDRERRLLRRRIGM